MLVDNRGSGGQSLERKVECSEGYLFEPGEQFGPHFGGDQLTAVQIGLLEFWKVAKVLMGLQGLLNLLG
jgi:hypothetical protein